MQNPLSKGGGFTSLKLSSLNSEGNNNHVWNSKKVNDIIVTPKVCQPYKKATKNVKYEVQESEDNSSS
jgi:hypothetical protein